MRPVQERALARAGAALESALRRRGFSPDEAVAGRIEVREWASARVSAVRDRRPILRGHRLLVTEVGRARLVPFEVLRADGDEATVRLDITAMSPGTERAQWLRLPDARTALPHPPGFSGAGTVVAAGADGDAAEGDRVAVLRATHQSLATVPAAWTVPVPDGVATAAASLAYLAVISGWGLERAGGIDGREVLVVGAGPIGALAQRQATAAGGRTSTVARSPAARAATMAAGAAAFHLAGELPPDLTADVVIEATGTSSGLQIAIDAAADGATVVQLGSPRGPTRGVDVRQIKGRSLRLVGAHISTLVTEARRRGGHAAVDDTFRALARRYLDAVDGGMSVDDLVGEPLDPTEATIAYRRLVDGSLRSGHFDWSLLPEDWRLAPSPLLRAPVLRHRQRAQPAAIPTPTTMHPTAAGPMRFAVVGCGDIGLGNARSIAGADGATVAICHDLDPGLAQAAGATVSRPWTADLDVALDPDQVDTVVLSLPHHLHEPLALRAIDAGLHVVVEKPLAVDVRSATAIVDAARAAGVAVTTCFPYRYEPDVVRATALARAGALGRVRGFCIVFHADKPAAYWHGGFSGRAASNWRSRPEEAGGGVLIMNATHHVDLLRHLTGQEIVEVHAVAGGDDGSGIEDRIAISARLANGAVGTLTASSATPGAPEERFEVWGDLGTIRIAPTGAVFTDRAIAGVAVGAWNTFEQPDDPVDSRRTFFAEFARSVHDGRPPEVSAEDGLAVQRFVEAAYTSHRQRTSVDPSSVGDRP